MVRKNKLAPLIKCLSRFKSYLIEDTFSNVLVFVQKCVVIELNYSKIYFNVSRLNVRRRKFAEKSLCKLISNVVNVCEDDGFIKEVYVTCYRPGIEFVNSVSILRPSDLIIRYYEVNDLTIDFLSNNISYYFDKVFSINYYYEDDAVYVWMRPVSDYYFNLLKKFIPLMVPDKGEIILKDFKRISLYKSELESLEYALYFSDNNLRISIIDKRGKRVVLKGMREEVLRKFINRFGERCKNY